MDMSHIPLNHLDTDEGCLFASSPPFSANCVWFFLGGKASVGFAVRCNWSAAVS